MRRTIDHNSPIPYYLQVIEVLKESILRGEWKVGDQLPSEPAMCEMFDVSRTVVRQALQELMQEGLITRRKGRGTYVAQPKISENLAQQLTGFYEDMASQGYETHSKVVKQHVIPASAKIAKYLEVAPGAQVIEIERIRYVQDEPLVLVTTYLDYERCSAALQAELTHQSLYAFLRENCDFVIVRGRRFIEAVPANEYESQQLSIRKGSPLLMLDSVSYGEDGRPIEYYHALHRADRLRFEVELLRVLKGDGKASLIEDRA